MTRLEVDPRFAFVVAGDHENTEYHEQIAELRTRFGPRLNLFGFVGGELKATFFESIDVLVFPSRYVNEASPMVCYEALAMGVPVIVTRVGAVEDIVDASCGVVIDRSEELVARMAEEARSLLAEPFRLEEWRAGAAARFAKLDRQGNAEFRELRQLLLETEERRAPAPAK
jgi:glycosyltransferase involved in cell wall biosynthesis